MACPVWALVRGLEYALDPNGDGITDDSVDVINISLGIPFLSPFYNFVASTLETVAIEYGVLPVISAGNSGNVPYVLGGLSGSPSSISVGATGHPDTIDKGVIALYSSRGPGENSMMKPDIVAPSGLTLAAVGTGIYRYRSIQGTSFSAPLVAGAAAVVMARCPECGPFAIKAILMNNANRGTRYYNNTETLSPITLSGAGEMQVDKALDADMWAYSVQDVQPSISLGLVNAASSMSFTRTIKVINLSDNPKSLSVSSIVRHPNHPYLGAMQIAFNTTTLELPGACNSEAYVEVTFFIDASRAPPNHMTSGGAASFNPVNLDMHELGGHIVLLSLDDSKDISLPFVAIVRQASNVTVVNPVIPNFDSGPVDAWVGLSNNGAGTAQIDAFQLLLVSGDDAETSESGESISPNDFRYVGYRVLDVGRPGCTHLVEFAFHTWEAKGGRLVTEIYGVDIDVDGDKQGDKFLFNSGLAYECLVVDDLTEAATCVGMPPDHSTSSSNTVIRACSEELGITGFEGQLGIRFEAVSFTSEGDIIPTDASSLDETAFIMVDFPRPALRAPSYDILPGQSIEIIQVDGKTTGTYDEAPLGLMLVTNAFRSPTSTGAATSSTEAIVLLRDGLNRERLPTELTPDILVFPPAENLGGPGCSWQLVDEACDGGALGNTDMDININDVLESPIAQEDSVLNPVMPMRGFELTHNGIDDDGISDICTPVEVPRAPVVISVQSASASPGAIDAGTNATGRGGHSMGGTSTSSFEAESSRSGALPSVSLVFVGIVSVLMVYCHAM
jgi:Subtilase family